MAEAKKLGRPTLYRPEYCQMLIDHMSKGHSLESFGAMIRGGVDKDTIYEWIKKHPDFSVAFREARQKAMIWWEKIGMGQAAGKVKGNSGTWIFWMKNRFGWKEDSNPMDEDTDLEFTE